MIVPTKNGKVKGFQNESIATGKNFHSFLGIPYAKPPVGDLRFAPPEPIDRWDDVYDATYERNECAQMKEFGHNKFDKMKGAEDCLFLNIHTPEVNKEALRPVLFIIHGGGFFMGSGSQDFMGADYLMEYDVVVVTINYRLHILGFINLQLPECPGNAGMKDQLLALKWVKDNIKEFGGNPENITITGMSAGATSVHLMMISPQTKGLFQRAIMQSGNSLCSWAITRDPIKWAFEVGHKLGFKGDDRQDLLKFLKSVSLEDLFKVTMEIFIISQTVNPGRRIHVHFGPTIENIKEGAFLPDFPENLMENAEPIPCIAGYCEIEALFNFPFLIKFAENQNNPEDLIEDIIKDNYKVNETQLNEMKNKLKLFYFQQKYDDKLKCEMMNDLLTDLTFLRFYDSLEFVSRTNTPAYVYHFKYFIEDHFYRKQFAFTPNQRKASHCEECQLLYAIRKADPPVIPKDIDAKVQKNICQLFTNFMKNGAPSNNDFEINWKPCTTEEPCYLQIDAEFKLRRGKINEIGIQFLKDLFRDVEPIE